MLARLASRPIVADPRSLWRAVRLEATNTSLPMRLWLAVLAMLLAIGAVAAVRALIPGDKGLATTPTFEWGLLIVGYVFFAVTTSGLCLASSLGTVFGIDRFRPLEKRHAVLALLCLVTAFGVIALDLHYPVRMVFGAAFSPSPASPMWWMGVFYGIYLVFLATEVWSIFWRHPRIHAWACVAASAMAVVAPMTLGAVFAVIVSRPSWAGLFTPLLMLATGLLSGTALLGAVFALVVRHRRAGHERAGALGIPAIRTVLAVALLLVAVLIGHQLVVGLWSRDLGLSAATTALVSGPLAVQWWGMRVVGGLLLPVLLLLVPRTRGASGVFAASVLIIVGVFADRLVFVSAGQVAPTTVVSGVASAPYAAYSPSLVEVGILAGAVGFVGFAYTMAERFLDLRESEVHIGVWLWMPRLWGRAAPAAVAELEAPSAEPVEVAQVEVVGVAEVEPVVLTVAEPAVEAEPEPAVAEPAVEAEPAAAVAEPEPAAAEPEPAVAAPEPAAVEPEAVLEREPGEPAVLPGPESADLPQPEPAEVAPDEAGEESVEADEEAER